MKTLCEWEKESAIVVLFAVVGTIGLIGLIALAVRAVA